jgi:hypothetical protein
VVHEREIYRKLTDKIESLRNAIEALEDRTELVQRSIVMVLAELSTIKCKQDVVEEILRRRELAKIYSRF